jgi:hypothetical protein
MECSSACSITRQSFSEGLCDRAVVEYEEAKDSILAVNERLSELLKKKNIAKGYLSTLRCSVLDYKDAKKHIQRLSDIITIFCNQCSSHLNALPLEEGSKEEAMLCDESAPSLVGSPCLQESNQYREGEGLIDLLRSLEFNPYLEEEEQESACLLRDYAMQIEKAEDEMDQFIQEIIENVDRKFPRKRALDELNTGKLSFLDMCLSVSDTELPQSKK